MELCFLWYDRRMDIASIIDLYGYPVLFIATLLEGETVVALSGFAAYQGYLALPIVILVALLGAIIGDQTLFLFGKYKGREFLENHPELHGKVVRVHQLLEKYQNVFIFGSRYLYGFRLILPIVMGTSNIRFRRFFFWNMLGALVWASLFSLIGFFFGGAIEAILGNIKKFEGYVALAIIVIILVVHQVVWRKRKKTLDVVNNTESKTP